MSKARVMRTFLAGMAVSSPRSRGICTNSTSTALPNEPSNSVRCLPRRCLPLRLRCGPACPSRFWWASTLPGGWLPSTASRSFPSTTWKHTHWPFDWCSGWTSLTSFSWCPEAIVNLRLSGASTTSSFWAKLWTMLQVKRLTRLLAG
uniref:Uncharacterized protein n=1 Tax=Ixodes ricinus TaxID=34613 RepID=A0A6B0UVC0_IXORI